LLSALWNLADARVKCAECAAECGEREAAHNTFTAAFRTYEAACGRADSQAGDDLGGLLFDWGCGLVASANNLAESAASSNPAAAGAALSAAHATLDAAEEKLRHAAEFSAGSAEPLNAFGEGLQARADLLRAGSSGAAAVGASSSDVDAPLVRALAPDGGGFGSALRLDATNQDALVGVAEVHTERGRVAALASSLPTGGNTTSAEHFRLGWACFQRVLAAAGRHGGDPGTVSDRLGVAYNAACAAHLAGFSAEAGQLLAQVTMCGGTTAEAVAADEDLRGLPPAAWGGKS
jgi:hypothetical protein